jgi:fructose-specific phosphotransferase system component IIB
LTASDLRGVDAVILAIDIAIENRERFDGMRVIQVPVQEAIKNPKGVLDKATV